MGIYRATLHYYNTTIIIVDDAYQYIYYMYNTIQKQECLL